MTTRRITLVTDEIRGIQPVGGIGTGTTFLALGLSRMGHEVEILHLGTAASSIDPDWRRIYDHAGIRIRFVPASEETIEPRYFARLPETAHALDVNPADVVITQDTAAPAYVALRLRQLGIANEQTPFVVFCHGTRGWMKDVARNIRVFPYLLGITMLERASVELADIVVSPSAYLLDWMRSQGWQLPRSVVIPYLTESIATGQAIAPPIPLATNGRVRRVVFFGRLDERKGIRPFATAMNALEPELLERIELEFLGAEIPMKTEHVKALLSERTKQALHRILFVNALDRNEALARLRRPGSLAVMPSLEDNSPNTVYECLEHGIPFVASRRGGTAELIAPDDADRTLFEPTPAGVEAALRRALTSTDSLKPVHRAFDPADSLAAWGEVIATARPPRRKKVGGPIAVDVVVVRHGSEADLERCLSALKRQTHAATNVVVTGSRDETELETPFVVFVRDDDEPAPDFIASLVRAQTTSDADVVSCGLHLPDPPRQHLFLGDPGGLGLLSNSFGGAALIRRSLLDDRATSVLSEEDPDWPLLARLYLGGARIVSIPLPLLSRRAAPGSVGRHPTESLVVLQAYERAMPNSLRSLARLAAGLAAEFEKTRTAPAAGRFQRAWEVARKEGFVGLARRVARRLPRK